jgi:hypothetical protein
MLVNAYLTDNIHTLRLCVQTFLTLEAVPSLYFVILCLQLYQYRVRDVFGGGNDIGAT